MSPVYARQQSAPGTSNELPELSDDEVDAIVLESLAAKSRRRASSSTISG